MGGRVVTDGGKRMLDLDDHWERYEAVWPKCPRCSQRYRRDLGHKCLLDGEKR